MSKWIISCAIILVALGLLLYALGTDDNHHTNLKYILWKYKWLDYDKAQPLKYLVVDADFRISLRGKTKTAIMEWFPNLRSPDQANEYQQRFNHHLEGTDFFWIGDSDMAIEFEDGKLKEFHIPNKN